LFDNSIIIIEHGLVERRNEGKDAWGVMWKTRETRSGGFPVFHPIKDPDEIDVYSTPSPEDPSLLDDAKRLISEIDRNNVVVAGDNGWGLFERAWLLVGMERLFLWSFLYPDAVKELIEKIAYVKIRLTERLIEEIGVDMIMYGDDWGMEDRLLFSPKWWRVFIKPWQKRLYRIAKDNDVLVYQHSDGKVEELIPDLIEIGVDILNIQRECNDWYEIKRKYGKRITLWGGVSARTLDHGTPEDVMREVKECIELGRDGGIILAPGHSLKYPKKNLEAMREAWLKYGWFICKKSSRRN